MLSFAHQLLASDADYVKYSDACMMSWCNTSCACVEVRCDVWASVWWFSWTNPELWLEGTNRSDACRRTRCTEHLTPFLQTESALRRNVVALWRGRSSVSQNPTWHTDTGNSVYYFEDMSKIAFKVSSSWLHVSRVLFTCSCLTHTHTLLTPRTQEVIASLHWCHSFIQLGCFWKCCKHKQVLR